MITVSWLLQHLADVPDDDDWLSPSEREVLAGLRVPKRRRDWRLGRWTGKRAIARAGVDRVDERVPGSWSRFSIRADEAGVPRVVTVTPDPCWNISLSHSGDYGLCALTRPPSSVGCDVETVGRRGAEFVVDWFTDAERAITALAATPDAQAVAVTLIWAAKESALKALGVGLRLATRQVEVDVAGPFAISGHAAWLPLTVRAPDRTLHGWWQSDGLRVMTVVSDPAPDVPVRLCAASD